MTDPQLLSDLLARVEAAEGASRRIDGDIAEACGLVPSWCVERSVKQPELWRGPGAGLRASTWLAPPVTSSLDASLALVERVLPEANCVGLDKTPRHCDGYVSRNCVASGRWYVEATAKTPALSVLAALLKAKLAEQESAGG